MGWFVFSLIITGLGIILLVMRRMDITEGGLVNTKLIGGLVVVLGVLMIAGASTVTVPTRNIGVTTAYGKPTGTLTNGIHVIAPWEEVTTYDATIQTLNAELQVRIANGAVAKMQTTTHWRLDPKADIQQLHMDWREFSRLQSSVVVPRLQNVLNKTFEAYDPLIALKESGGKPQPLSAMESSVKAQLQASMPTGMIIDLVQLPLVVYPDQVQRALDDFQKELAATQVAIQQQKTAEAQKLALETLNSAKLSPEAFQMQCLIMTERLAQQGKTISAMWSCVAPNAGAALALK